MLFALFFCCTGAGYRQRIQFWTPIWGAGAPIFVNLRQTFNQLLILPPLEMDEIDKDDTCPVLRNFATSLLKIERKNGMWPGGIKQNVSQSTFFHELSLSSRASKLLLGPKTCVSSKLTRT
jgi:hypothetical protein